MEQTTSARAYRITVALRAQLEWAGAESGARQGESGPAVVTNFSGGDAQVFLRQLPSRNILELILSTPEGFEESKAAAA